MIFVDTHAHIFFRNFDRDREAVVDRAVAAGVAAVFDVGLEIESNRTVMDYAELNDAVFAIVGFHPHEAKDYDHGAFADFLAEAEGRYVGLGEFGLDYYVDLNN